MSFLLAWFWFFMFLLSLGANVVLFLLVRPSAAADWFSVVGGFVKSKFSKGKQNAS
jgi:hypothetical protein